MQFIFPVAVFLVLLAALLFVVKRAKDASQQVADLTTQFAEKSQQNAVLVSQIENANERLSESNGERDTLRSELLAAKTSLAELQGRSASDDEAKRLLKAEFAQAAVDALQSNSQTFLNLAEGKLNAVQAAASGELETKKAAIDGLIAPMANSLRSLDESVRSLKQSEAGLLNETRELASALKETKVRGNWGELQLRRIAELSGMEERCDFELQKYVTTDDNRRLYPDMVVYLPNNRVVVVDSKASMEAYRQSTLATDENVRQQKLIEHAKAVRTRVDELASKEYRSHIAESVDFVICFIPGEAFFSAALAIDESLLEYAAAKSVMLASPTTLLTHLRAVALGWKEVRLAEDAKEICEVATELYDRFRVAADHVKSVGGGLENALNAYNSFISSVESRVFPQARRIQKLTEAEKDLPKVKTIDIATKKLGAMDWEFGQGVVKTLAADVGNTEPEKLIGDRLSK